MSEVIISADSHVMEPHDLWSSRLPEAMRSSAAVFPPPQTGPGFDHHPGGSDPHARIREMAVDGVSAEVLYPTLGLRLFGIDDARTQEACFRIYNDWLIDYCAVNNDRLLGIPALSVYNIDAAVAELERTHRAGLAGAIIWQTPHPGLPFTSTHYDKLWAAAQEMDAPVALHILTGHNYTKRPSIAGTDVIRTAVNAKMNDTLNGLFDIIISGTLDRFPRLKIVIVESEIGWMPFYFQQWDYYFRRFNKSVEFPITIPPSEYVNRGQVWATFFNDTVGGHNLGWWGQEVCMWSSDYPHPNSPWPNSLKVIDRDLGHLPGEVRAKLVRENVARLYHMRVPETVAVG